MTKRIIRRKIFMGDSLSDRGTLDHLKVLNIIPMSLVSGLAGKSPRGRFTNGFLWVDMVGAVGIENLEIDHWRHHLKLEDNPVQNADLSDFILAKRLKRNREAFTLADDKNILFNGTRYLRSYCEGGATSADWKEKITTSPKEEGARLIVSNLSKKRKQLLADDFKYSITQEEKAETLITEWSGANDLITVNSEPTLAIAEQAVAARIANIESLIKSGYRNFVLMNLPDLGLTPRYQLKGGKEKQIATECSKHFNELLASRVEELKVKYKNQNVFLDVFDVSSLLTMVYNDPQTYDFDKSKLTTPYTESEEFKQNQTDPENQTKQISPAKGYMFWDDVHPTATMHAWLAEKYMEKYDSIFDYKSPTNRSHIHNETMQKRMKNVKDKYNLDVPSKLEHKEHGTITFASPKIKKIIEVIEKIEEHCNALESSHNGIAKKKGKELRELLTKVYKAQDDILKIDRILNSKATDSAFNIHRNPRWDKFWKKTTTRTEDMLRDFQIAVDEALNENQALFFEPKKTNL